MRAPRYRFPEQVRSTTRTIAARMVREGETAETPKQLDAWLARHADERQTLERGGYGDRFTANDLFPLLQVFIVKAGGKASEAAAPVEAPRPRWLIGLVIAVSILLLLLLALATGLFSVQ